MSELATIKQLRERIGSVTRIRNVIADVHKFQEPHMKLVQQVDQVSIGKALRKLREDSGISLRGMAQAIGVSASFLSDVELGRCKLSMVHSVLFLDRAQRGA